MDCSGVEGLVEVSVMVGVVEMWSSGVESSLLRSSLVSESSDVTVRVGVGSPAVLGAAGM